MSDHYKTLGIERGASADEIKSAYRKMASKHHPDKGGDTAKFQEIQAAYAALTGSGPAQDQGSPFNFRDFGGAQFTTNPQFHSDFEDLLRELHRKQRHDNARRNLDVKTQVSITLAETLVDQERTITVRTGGEDRKTVNITIPRGVGPNATIKYTGLGDNRKTDAPAGDLYVNVHVIIPEDCVIYHTRIDQLLEVDALHAILGGDVTVKTVFGEELVVGVPAGVQTGTRMRLQNRGQAVGKTDRGDLYLLVKVIVPKDLPEQAIELIRQAQAATKSS